MSTTSSDDADRRWFITQRWQQYEAEGRANLLRIVAIGSFYLVHLWTFFSAQGRLPQLEFLQIAQADEISASFHVAVTLLAVAWSMLAMAIHLCLQHEVFPRWLPYFSTAADIFLLTSVICIGAGSRSPIIAGYFLILVLAALRFSLPLVRFATIGSVIAYIFVLGCPTFQIPGTLGVAENVPRYHQLMMVLAMLLTGIMLGQLVRSVRTMAERHHPSQQHSP